MPTTESSPCPVPSSTGRPFTLRLSIRGIGHCPSFKNHKRAILDTATGRMRTLTEKSVKARMALLEDAILSALYSACPTTESATALEWLKRLRTQLSGLSDDSIQVIPRSSWDTEQVETGQEGIDITITRIEATGK